MPPHPPPPQPAEALAIALENGRAALGVPGGGRLVPGAAADLVVLDRASLDEDAMMDTDPLDLLFSRATRRHVRELIVAGRRVVRDGRVVGVDLDAAHREVRERLRAGLAARAGLRAALPAFEAAVRGHYAPRLGCC